MLYEDFYSFDGHLSTVLHNVNVWLEENNPKNPVLVIVEQGSHTHHFRIYYED